MSEKAASSEESASRRGVASGEENGAPNDSLSPDDPLAVASDDASEIEALARALRRAEGFSLFFAVCDNNAVRDRAISDVKERLGDSLVRELAVREPVDNLLDLARQTDEGVSPRALFVYGMEGWLPAGDEAEKSPFVVNLNETRNQWPNALSSPLVLWVPSHVLRSIAHGAPDFCSVRSGIYAFEATAEERDQIRTITIEADLAAIAGLPHEEKLERVTTLEDLLKQHESLPEEKRDPQVEERLLQSCADFYYVLARYDVAEPLLRRLLEMAEASHGPDHPEVGVRLNNLAQLLKTTNRLAEAEPLMRRALEIDEAAFGIEHPEVARDLSNLAQLLHDTNRLAESEPLMRRALAIFGKSCGPDHPQTQMARKALDTILRQKAK